MRLPLQRFIAIKIPLLFFTLSILNPCEVRSEIVPAGYNDPENPVFSIDPGFYSEDIELEILHPDPDVIIYYTTDGSEPTEDSEVYSSPLLLSDPSSRPNSYSAIPTNINFNWRTPPDLVNKAHVIRVKAVKPGSGESETITGTWFINEAGTDRYSMRVVSIVTDSTNLFDEETGIYVPGVHYSPGENPWQQDGNFNQRGIEWERPASIELFHENGDLFLSQDIGIRIHGGITRSYAQKSLRLYSRSDYGVSRFNVRIFPELEDERFNRLILRNSGNDWPATMFRDAAAQSLVRHLNVDTQAWHPSIVFINGEYWGIHHFRERYDRHYLERVYGVDPDNVDMLTERDEVDEGDDVHYKQMISFLESSDLNSDELFAEAATMMDIDNFLDYYSAQIYYANNDWPHNNIDFWRLRTEFDPYAPKGHDGRWRWLLYDADRSLGYSTDYTFNMMEHITGTGFGNQEWPNLILNNLLENESFRYQFINRIADQLNTAFLPDRVHGVIDSLKAIMEPEMMEHIERWGHPPGYFWWQGEVDIMYENALKRPEYVFEHVMDHFDIESLVELTVDVSHPNEGTVGVNSLTIAPTTPGIEHVGVPWTGTYFQGIPVTLTAEPEPGYLFSHWSGDLDEIEEPLAQSSQLTLRLSESSSITAHFREKEPGEERQHQILHYWVFDSNLANDTPLEFIAPVFSVNDGAELEYKAAIAPYPPESGTEGIMDRVNDPTEINYFPEVNNGIPYEDSDMRGIRARNPSLTDEAESSIVFHLPTGGYEEISFSFPTARTGSGQQQIILDYSVSPFNEEWTQAGLERTTAQMYEIWNLNTFSFSGIEQANDNPFFKIRLRFGGDEEILRDDSGNVRFNNILLQGNRITIDPDDSSGNITLYQNRPNPFHSETLIGYRLQEQSEVRLDVYDLLGRRIATLVEGVQPAGNHFIKFDGSGIASGIYIYYLKAGNDTAARKMTFIR